MNHAAQVPGPYQLLTLDIPTISGGLLETSMCNVADVYFGLAGVEELKAGVGGTAVDDATVAVCPPSSSCSDNAAAERSARHTRKTKHLCMIDSREKCCP